AADASITEEGISFGPQKTPQAKTPGREEATGEKPLVRANPLVSISIPILSASAFDSFETSSPVDRTTMSKISACIFPVSSTYSILRSSELGAAGAIEWTRQ